MQHSKFSVQWNCRGAQGTHTSFLRLNYYPPSPPAASNSSAGAQDGPALGINHHTGSY